MTVLKVELHAHTDRDPADLIAHSTRELVDHAASLGYAAVAITLHDRACDVSADGAYARERGVTLIPGVERTLAHRHILLVNFPPEAASARSFDEIAGLKRRCNGLVVAPHPFYPTPSALGRLMDRHRDLIDAVELNAMYTPLVDFNRKALRWANANGKPVVGNTDLHLLEQLGTTYSLVDAEPDPDAICDAIRAGRVEVRTTPLSLPRAGWIFTKMGARGIAGRLGPGR